MSAPPYLPRRASRSEIVPIRGLQYHLRHWGDAALATPEQPPLLMLHGWMDVGASFQFIVDALADSGRPPRQVIAPDWRGFGLSEWPARDGYWFADYLGDLDAIVDGVLALLPGIDQIDLLGHSMGGNIAMVYAGVRPQRVRRLINLEGFGLPATRPEMAPKRYAQWLDELKLPATISAYKSADAVATRLQRTNPLLSADRAAWLARQWAREDDSGRWQILGDPLHKRGTPTLYQRDEVIACWRQITAPLMWVEGDRTDISRWWDGQHYSTEEFHQRLSVVTQVQKHRLSPAGHMVHHDQPEVLAGLIEAFLDAAAATSATI